MPVPIVRNLKEENRKRVPLRKGDCIFTPRISKKRIESCVLWQAEDDVSYSTRISKKRIESQYCHELLIFLLEH